MKRLTVLTTSVWLTFGCGAPATGFDGGELPIDAGAQLLALAAGEVAELSITDGQAGVRLSTPTGSEKFVVVLASTRLDSSRSTSTYALTTGAAPELGTAAPVTSCSLSASPWAANPPPLETPPTGTAPDAGTTRTLNMQTPTGIESITVQAIASSASAVVWADVTPAHPADLDAGFVDQFLQDFESTILPRERALFGVESDADGDGHIGLVFTPLTYQTAVAFFTQCDLQALQGCPGNGGEYLYLTPPATIAPPYNTPNAIKEILSHECSHLIHFNRKVLRNGLSRWPDSAYLDEGVGAFAQDAVGPQAGNLYVAKAGLDGINRFSLSEVLVDGLPYDSTRDGLLRGGAYWFVRYLYDRAGGDHLGPSQEVVGEGGPAFLRNVLDAPASVAHQLPTATGSQTADIAMDFYTTLAMSNRDQDGGVGPQNACFEYLPTVTDPKWNRQRGADVYAQFSMKMTGPATQASSSADGSLLSGGVEYLRLDATAAGELPFTLQVAPDAQPRVRVARVQ